MDTQKLAKKMLDAGNPAEEPLRDEEGKIVSTIAVVVSEECTTAGVKATPFGLAMAIINLFQNVRTDLEKDAILSKLIAIRTKTSLNSN